MGHRLTLLAVVRRFVDRLTGIRCLTLRTNLMSDIISAEIIKGNRDHEPVQGKERSTV